MAHALNSSVFLPHIQKHDSRVDSENQSLVQSFGLFAEAFDFLASSRVLLFINHHGADAYK